MKRFLLILFLIGSFNKISAGQYCEIVEDECTYEGQTINENDVLPNSSSYDSDITDIIFSGCNVYSFPAEIFDYFTNAETLKMEAQGIKQIKEKCFEKAENLKMCLIGGNDIQTIEENVFSGAGKLETLGLYKNIINNVHENAFLGLKKLKNLALAANKIEIIHEKLFEPLPKLEEIYLQQNKIHYLSENLFKKNLKLKLVSLWGNGLTALSNTMFSHLVNLKELHIQHNDCETGYAKWESNAFQSIKQIEESLKKCNDAYSLIEAPRRVDKAA